MNNRGLNIFIFGSPGVGKGTYSKMLVKDIGFRHISVGDEIRKLMKEGTGVDTE